MDTIYFVGENEKQVLLHFSVKTPMLYNLYGEDNLANLRKLHPQTPWDQQFASKNFSD